MQRRKPLLKSATFYCGIGFAPVGNFSTLQEIIIYGILVFQFLYFFVKVL